MLDLKRLRDEPERVKEALAKRGPDIPAAVDEILALDEDRREAIGEADRLKAERNEASKRIGELKRAGEDASELIASMKEVGEDIAALDERISVAEERIEALLLDTPNAPRDEVPQGGEEDNVVVREWGTPVGADFELRPHWELGEEHGILDLPRGARISGSGFPVLAGWGARLQRLLIDWMIDLHRREHGYREVRVPYLVTRETLVGTGQLPKFEEDVYQTPKDDLFLIPTAEVPVTNLHRDEILEPDDVPVRYVAYSPCFRREAGAAGKDTRGLLRVHQFDKVELVRYEAPGRSGEALEELTAEAAKVLELLELPYRVVLLASGDLGFSSAKTYDLEVWAPGVEQWLEVSSCSTFDDFQARRANLRFRPQTGEKPEFVHTLNGSGLALPRLMVAILESYQEADGRVRVPEALRELWGAEYFGE